MGLFTEKICKVYQQEGFTNRSLAKALGLSHPYVFEILNGRIPAESVIIKLADILNLNRAELLLLAREERTDSPEAADIYAKARLDIPVLECHGTGTVEPPPEAKTPLIAYVSAGEPFECSWTDAGLPVGAALEWVDVPPDGKVRPGMYAVRVKGESMLPLIKPDAILYVDPNIEPMNNDIVIYRDNDHAWVKRVHFSGSHIVLKSFNPAFEDIVVDRKQALVLHPVAWFKIR